jgi:hypothetical protein
MTSPLPKPGQTLPNGALIVAVSAKPRRPVTGTADDLVLLAWTGTDYVTWQASAETLDCYWGHYHAQDFAGASADFLRRAGQV